MAATGTPERTSQSQASEPLRRFLQVARSAGLRISAAEGIDAARALDLVGYADRTTLKDTLGLILAKTADEKIRYEETFDLYFRRDALSGGDEPAGDERARTPGERADGPPGDASPMGGADQPSLAELLESGERIALATAVEHAAHAAGVQKIRLLTQKNRYVREILERMGLAGLERELAALRRSDAQPAGERARLLEERLERLWDAVRDLVERNLLLFARGETEQFRERLLKSARLANLDLRDLERMRVLTRRIAKRLATRFSRKRRRKQRGQLDVRRTLRRNMAWGGIPFVTAWKYRKIDKARLMVLCDVSESVAWIAQFLLMFVYALTEALSDIRSFAYTGSLTEVSQTLENNTIDEAIARIMATVGFGTSDYGQSFADFEAGWMQEVTSKTVVIILGDARGNDTDPRTDIFERIAKRAKRVIWLNPEFRSSWGTGDSDMYRYAPYCSLVRVCASLNDLERVITDLLEAGNA